MPKRFDGGWTRLCAGGCDGSTKRRGMWVCGGLRLSLENPVSFAQNGVKRKGEMWVNGAVRRVKNSCRGGAAVLILSVQLKPLREGIVTGKSTGYDVCCVREGERPGEDRERM